MHGPGYGRNVTEFVRRFREKKMLRARAKLMEQAGEVRQLLRRFPDLDLDHVQRLYPRVPVQKLKRDVDLYRETQLVDKQFTRFNDRRQSSVDALASIKL